MTFERPMEVGSTIKKLMEQTLAPQKILIVDNSNSFDTDDLIRSIGNEKIEYYRVGHNSGPAGAAHIGLRKLTEEGYEWIYWGDDDNPPKKDNDFEKIFNVVDRAKGVYGRIGIVGKRAGKFNPLTARTSIFRNTELRNEIMEGDCVAGGSVLVVNSAVVKNGALPSEDLFFGFEELDFCLQVRRAKFKIIFDAGAFLTDRKESGNADPLYKWSGRSFGDSSRLWRQYYSTRNMLKILLKNGLWAALFLNIGKTIVKGVYGFRFGWKFGICNFRVQKLALTHFFSGKYGKANLEYAMRKR